MKSQKLIIASAAITLFMSFFENKTEAQSWSLSGNAGTTSTNFVGTSDSKVLRFRTNNINRMVINTGGNVGIGTTSPTSKLHIKGEINQESTGGLGIKFSESGSPGTFLHSITHMHSNGSDVNNALMFNVSNGAGVTNQSMILNGAGNVGIGTSSPAARLHVKGDMNQEGVGGIKFSETGLPNTFLHSITHMHSNGSNINNALMFNVSDGAGVTNQVMTLNGAGQVQIKGATISNQFSDQILRIESSSDCCAPSIAIHDYFPAAGLHYSTKLIISSGLAVKDSNGINYLPISASAFNVLSDKTMKKDIVEVTSKDYEDYLNQIRNIESITYRYNNEMSGSDNLGKMYNVREVPHVGFTAQSLPPAVQTNMSPLTRRGGEMKLGYNLSDMAGLTLIGIKALDARQTIIEKENTELKERLNKMEQALAACCSSSDKARNNIAAGNVTGDHAGLEQNQPNPFNTRTKIKFYIPSGFVSAVVSVTDLVGTEVKSFVVKNEGYGEVFINSNELTQGSYIYNLYLDGKQVDSKVMILTK